MDEPRTLILGASSLVGRFLTPQLIKRGVRPLVVSRGVQPMAPDRDAVRLDLTSDALSASLPPLGLVYSLSPIWLLPPALPALIERGARRVVAFSSTSRFTKTQSIVSSEREVAAKLIAGEDQVIALCRSAGVEWTILRPTLIYCEGRDGNVTRLAKLIKKIGFLPLAGRGEGLRQPVHAEDLALVAINAAEAPAAVNQSYDLPGGETLSYREMAQRVFTGLGRSPLILTVPAPLWSLAFQAAKPLLPGATPAMGLRMSHDLVFDPSAARRDLLWEPRSFHPNFSKSL